MIALQTQVFTIELDGIMDKSVEQLYPGSEKRSKQKNLEIFLRVIEQDSLFKPDDDILTTLFACSKKTLERAKSALTTTEVTSESPKRGAPPKFPPTLMPKLVAWVKEQTFDGRPPTREELTAQAYQILINNGEEVILSKSWVDSLLRSQDSPFKQVKSKIGRAHV